MGVLLEVKNLGISFGGLRAVDGLNMTINEGALVGLIGPNGAGKTLQHADRCVPADRRHDSSRWKKPGGKETGGDLPGGRGPDFPEHSSFYTDERSGQCKSGSSQQHQI